MELQTIQQQLIEEINKGKTQYVTDGYYMSIGELLSMYRDGDLIINPDFQRLFRWSLKQQSKLIESILIGVPLPSIFVYQDANGRWEVVDGVQRISTIFAFMGELLDEKGQKQKTSLEKTKMIPTLEGLTWDKVPREPVQLDFRRSKLEIKIIKYLSDKNAKFEVFQRINLGGTLLSEQEFRNAVMVAFDKNLYKWVVALSEDSYFVKCTDLTERWIEEKYHQELVLRLFVFSIYDFKSTNMNDYLNDSFFDADDAIVQRINKKNFDIDLEKQKFNKTFVLLDKAKGKNVFKKRETRISQFLESYFEVIGVGLYYNIEDYDDSDANIAIIKQKIDDIEKNIDFLKTKKSNDNSVQRAKRTVTFGKAYFKK